MSFQIQHKSEAGKLGYIWEILEKSLKNKQKKAKKQNKKITVNKSLKKLKYYIRKYSLNTK